VHSPARLRLVCRGRATTVSSLCPLSRWGGIDGGGGGVVGGAAVVVTVVVLLSLRRCRRRRRG
jgi:hypothetical protein